MSPASERMPGALAILAVLMIAIAAMSSGSYGLTLFVLLPVVAGGVLSYASRASSAGEAVWRGALGAFLGCFALLAFGMEGLICVAMAAPLAVPLGALGGWLAYKAQHGFGARSSTVALLVLPLGLTSMGLDAVLKPALYQVQTQLEIAAPPETVWKHVVSFSDIPEPDDWYFKTGIAYPKRARIEGRGPGAIRYCEFSTGPFVEPITTWDEPRLLQFAVTENPAPMNEWSPYANLAPQHLRGYFTSERGQFRLTELPNGHTLLEGTTWYRHGLQPGPYWRLWSDEIIHRIHLRVLNHIRGLAEADVAAGIGPGEI